MKLSVKLVASVLAIALVAVPAEALSKCWTSPHQARQGCGADCPMMAVTESHPAHAAVQGNTTGSSCCEVSSAKPRPATLLQTPTDRSVTAVTHPQSLMMLAAILVCETSDSPGLMPTAPATSAQAVLCTFLI